MPSSKSQSKAERLLNLVIALLNSERFRDVSWIRDKVDGYGDVASDEAFFRMFERDKGELRDLGIPLQTSEAGSYRIPRGEFALPEMVFTAGEQAALALAARLWETTVLGAAGSGGLRKLVDASGSQPDQSPAKLSLQPRVRTSDPAFAPLYAAVQSRSAVTFDYRKSDSTAVEARRLQPWGLVSWRGRWYVVGHDVERAGQRTFRLSRIAGQVRPIGRAGAVTVPTGLDLMAIVAGSAPVAEHRTAIVQLAAGAGAGLRRQSVAPAAHRADDVGYPALSGFERLQIPMDHLWDTARALAALGPDALAESPPDLVDAVVRLLTEAQLSDSGATVGDA